MNGTIFIRRDEIQFERLPYPDDGNSYTRQAAHAWECAATEHIERAGYRADVEATHGRDHCKYCVWVEPAQVGCEDVALTEAELAAALAVADEADSVGVWAAHDFAERDAAGADAD